MVRAVAGAPVGAQPASAIGTPPVLEAPSGVQALAPAGRPEAIPEAMAAAPAAVAMPTAWTSAKVALLLPTRLAPATVGGEVQAPTRRMGGPVPAVAPRRAPDAMGVAIRFTGGLRRATPSRKVAPSEGAPATPKRVTTGPIMVGLVVGPVLIAAETTASEAVQTAAEAGLPVAEACPAIGAVLAAARPVVKRR